MLFLFLRFISVKIIWSDAWDDPANMTVASDRRAAFISSAVPEVFFTAACVHIHPSACLVPVSASAYMRLRARATHVRPTSGWKARIEICRQILDENVRISAGYAFL